MVVREMATEDAGTLGRLQSVALLHREGGWGGGRGVLMENIVSLSTAHVLRFQSQKCNTAPLPKRSK